MVRNAPGGVRVRKWNLREDIHSNYHGVVNISESPMYLELSWRDTDKDAVRRVGLFRLDLPGLLMERYIRWEPKDSSRPEVRVRIISTADGHFYLQVNQDGPRVLMV